MAGTVTQTYYNLGIVRKVVLDCVADAADASVPDTALTQKIEGFLTHIETNPGATAPTDSYDITLEDAEGLDVLMGAGANRDTTASEIAACPIGTVFNPPLTLDQTYTLKIANNAVNSAIIKIILFYSASAAG